jgi:hypothetical protein
MAYKGWRTFQFIRSPSGFGVVGVGFDFEDLLNVAFGVGPDEQDEFVSVPLGALAGGIIDSVIAETGCVPEEAFGFGAAFEEVIDRVLRRTEAVGGLDGFRGLNLVRAVFHIGDDGGIDFGGVAIGSGRGEHYFFSDHAADVVFGSGDVLHAFGDGPFFGGHFEIPLRGRKAFGGSEDIFLAGFEKVQGFAEIGLGELLSPGGHGTAESEEYGESNGERSERTLHC